MIKSFVFSSINRKEENSTNPRYIRVTARNVQKGDLSMLNEGFRGMGIKNGLRYDFSVYRNEIPFKSFHPERTSFVI